MPENVPIMLALCSMLARPYYAPNYAGIIRPSLGTVQRDVNPWNVTLVNHIRLEREEKAG